MLIAARRLVAADFDGPGWLQIAGDRIVDRAAGTPLTTPDVELDAVLPPFVDVHSHGAAGIDFGTLGACPEAALAHHRRNGSTVLVASLASAPLATLKARLAELAGRVSWGGLAGVHLEGPWLSPQRAGAHDPSLLRHPDPAEVLDVLEAGHGAVRMVTLAPELPGALAAIEAIVAEGVVAAIGHTAADAATVRRAVDAGATVVTHLFNGMPPLHHREVGLPGVALTDDRLWLELIADGQHVGDDAIALVRRVGAERLLLVSDSMAACGLGDGDFVLAGSRVGVRDGVARLAQGDSLAGSTATIADAIGRLPDIDHPDIVAWTNTNPAAALGLDVPRLRPGDRADLVAMTGCRVTRAMASGQWQEPR